MIGFKCSYIYAIQKAINLTCTAVVFEKGYFKNRIISSNLQFYIHDIRLLTSIAFLLSYIKPKTDFIDIVHNPKRQVHQNNIGHKYFFNTT